MLPTWPLHLLGHGRPKRSVSLHFFVCSNLSPRLSGTANKPYSPAFSANARASLSSPPTGSTLLNLSNQFQDQINTFPSNLTSIAVSKHQELDTEGLTLWNLCTRLIRSNDFSASSDQRTTLLAARVFAFLLLDGALGKENESLASVARLIRVAMKAAKSCIGNKL